MISFLEGILVSGGPEAVVAVGGVVGLDVQLSALAAARLPAPGEPVRLWTHLSVREDAWNLYGFVAEEERQMFRLLISVAGIGPKVALGMLSRAEPGDIAAHLRTGDEKALAKLPGIGKKSAARLLVELGQRVPEPGPPAADGARAAVGLGEALTVLGAMGLPGVKAEAALMRARADDPQAADNVETWVRAALRAL